MYDHTSSPAEAATVELLLAMHPALISRDELHREIGDRIAVDDAISRFVRLGIAHRLEASDTDFFWATRTALAVEESTSARLVHGSLEP